MSIIYILIPIAVLLTALGIYLFFWAVRTEQFDDLEKQGMSILFDEDETNNELEVTGCEKDKDSDELRVASNEEQKEINNELRETSREENKESNEQTDT